MPWKNFKKCNELLPNDISIFAIDLWVTTSALLAQTHIAERYIEVTAEDMLMAQSDYYEYHIRVIPYSESEDVSSYRDTFQIEKERRELNDVNEKLLQVLKHRKIPYKKIQHAAFIKVPSPANAIYEYTLVFTHVQQLASFFEEIKEVTQLEGYISLSRSSRTDAYEKLVTEKVLAKARRKATVLAQAAQAKLAVIIQMEEVVPAPEGNSVPGSRNWEIYLPLSAFPHSTTTDLLQITYKKTLKLDLLLKTNIGMQ